MEQSINALNRVAAPVFREIEKIQLEQPDDRKLDNGIDFYSINKGTQDLVRIELIFEAGSWYENKPLISPVTATMLREGTKNYTSAQLAEKFDYYGAHLNIESDPDFVTISLYTLNKHLTNVLPALYELITEPVFPQKELDLFLSNAKQKLKQNEEKVAFLARNHFKQMLFGIGHPYAEHPKAEYYDHISRNDLVSFHSKYLSGSNLRIIAAGKVGEDHYKLINQYFGKLKQISKEPETINKYEHKEEKHGLIRKEGAIQSAIRIGKKLFNKTHPDFHSFLVLNTVLGGYFGSRLMTNIREEKGYTYGIGSGVVSLLHDGYFFIATETGVDVTQAAIYEIYKEIEKLRSGTVPVEELKTVRNYMTGSFLRSIDGPFAIADRYKGVVLYGLDFDYYQTYISTVRTTGAEQIQELARKYLEENTLVELVAGSK
jgi:zinc protease